MAKVLKTPKDEKSAFVMLEKLMDEITLEENVLRKLDLIEMTQKLNNYIRIHFSNGKN